jgi:putative phage-type endonuclease
MIHDTKQKIKGKIMEKLEQNSSEWLKWRKQGIGASDVPAILGICPYRTANDIYLSKMDDAPESKGNWATNMGHELEPIARAHYEIHANAEFPAQLIEHRMYNFFRASLDGYNEAKKHHIEIKFVSDQVFEKGECPENYMAQIQFQMALAETTCDLVLINKNKDVKIIPIPRNDDQIAKMIPALLTFWENVTAKIPPTLEKSDCVVTNDTEMLALFMEYEKLKFESDILDEKMDVVKKKLSEKAFHPNIRCGKYKITRVDTKGKIKYDGIPELTGLDLEKYRGKGSTAWKITIGKV